MLEGHGQTDGSGLLAIHCWMGCHPAVLAIIGSSSSSSRWRCWLQPRPTPCALCLPYQVTGGMEPDADVGPMITPAAKQRAETLIQRGVEQGAQLWLDGRGVKVSVLSVSVSVFDLAGRLLSKGGSRWEACR